MTRLCIFVTYDSENIVDDYIGFLLCRLRKWVDSLVVVCNYESIVRGADNMEPYADRIFYRKNLGLDAGAYKDGICRYLGWDEVRKYDELLLVNDSFYGPLLPLDGLFHRMEEVRTDFWGLMRGTPGVLDDGCPYESHIQSYFLGFRKNILQSEAFRMFWERMEYPESLHEAVIRFELGCNRYLTDLGFKGTALTDFCEKKDEIIKGERPHLEYPYELIRSANIPVLKRKCLDFGNTGYGNALRALKYIEAHCPYDVSLIKKHLSRISQCAKNEGMINFVKLSEFYHSHSRIFFYGAGTYGKNLAVYFEYMGWRFAGFLVTDKRQQSETCQAFDEIEISKNDGIIIAVGRKHICLEILSIVEKRCRKDQIFYPNYCIGQEVV